MKNQALIYGIVGLIIGVVLTGAAMSFGKDNSASTMNHGSSMTSMSMDDMMKSLDGKSGDDFDKAFISSMIQHHEGAIDMAKEAQTNAKHDEIKSLANDIITAQEKEINQMKDWQKQWGY